MTFLLVEFGAQAGECLGGLGLFVGFAREALPRALFMVKSVDVSNVADVVN